MSYSGSTKYLFSVPLQDILNWYLHKIRDRLVHGVYGLYKQQNIDKTGDLDDGQLARVIGAYRANGVVAALTYQYTDGFRGLWASPLNTLPKTHKNAFMMR